MSFFHKKESLTEEFMSVYSHIHQYSTWLHGRIPPAFRVGIKEDVMQREVSEWAGRNSAALDNLASVRAGVVSNHASPAQLKAAIEQSKNLIADIEGRLQKLGRQN